MGLMREFVLASRSGLLISVVLVPISFSGCSASESTYGPSSVGAIRLTEPGGFPPRHLAAASAVFAELEHDGEEPSEFFAVVSEGPGVLEFKLWHSSAFLPENRGLNGNPGGECRTFSYDTATSKVVSKELWQ